jgi:23S rRNA maturation mini-RNase III
MKEIVFLLEEPSAKAMLEVILPKLLNESIGFKCIAFEGKQDLEKQLIRKVKCYQNPQARFIVLRDQDSACCLNVKHHLINLCEQTGKLVHCKVRIACHELETFYLGDLMAVEQALSITNLAKKYQENRKYRTPDNLNNAKQELKNLTNNLYQEKSGSKAIAHYMDLTNQRSVSFSMLISAIDTTQTALLTE